MRKLGVIGVATGALLVPVLQFRSPGRDSRWRSMFSLPPPDRRNGDGRSDRFGLPASTRSGRLQEVRRIGLSAKPQGGSLGSPEVDRSRAKASRPFQKSMACVRQTWLGIDGISTVASCPQ